MPASVALFNSIFRELEAEAARGAVASAGELELERFVDLKFRRQVHSVRIAVPAGELRSEEIERLMASFEEAYERIYGKRDGLQKGRHCFWQFYCHGDDEDV